MTEVNEETMSGEEVCSEDWAIGGGHVEAVVCEKTVEVEFDRPSAKGVNRRTIGSNQRRGGTGSSIILGCWKY